MTTLSVLDLAPVMVGQTPADSMRHSLALAQRAEKLGYSRYWLAEHHNMPGIASAATSVVIGYIAGGTKTIRVGAGGVMLPNHSPLVIAEQFGTLEALYPGRIDLGLGRAPGTDQRTLHALRRDAMTAQHFPQDVLELQQLLDDVAPGQGIQAVPGGGSHVPLWILGSSTFGAQLAAQLGLPYAFASHFAPDALDTALAMYRRQFRPSKQLQSPYVMVGLNAIAAETDQEATRLFTTIQQAFANLLRGRPGKMQPPIDDIEAFWSPAEKAQAQSMLSCAVVGGPQTVRARLAAFMERTRADEVMVVTSVFDPAARVRSYEILAEVGGLQSLAN